jgi:hypothetical protein
MTSNPSSPASPLEDISLHTASFERYVVGCDLGQSRDPTAIAVVRRLDDDVANPGRPIFQVGHLERLPLGTPYPGVVRHVSRMLGAAPLRGKAELVIDFTGVGRPVFDMFQGHGVSPIGVTITAGDAVTHEGMIYRVPKLALISRVQALLHDGRLKIHKGLPDAPALVAELQDFRAEVTDSGYWKFGARSGKHDDLVLAVAIALWRAHGDNVPGYGVFEHTRRLAAAQNIPLPEMPLPSEFGFTFAQAVGKPTNALVALKVPEGATMLYGTSGQEYSARGGVIKVQPNDVSPLLQLGCRRVAS